MIDTYSTSTDPAAAVNDPRDVNNLPPIGEGTKPENWNKVNTFMDRLALKAMNFYETSGQDGKSPLNQADTNLRVFEKGKERPVCDTDVINNKIRKDILSMMSDLLREAVTKTISPEETGEPPTPVPFIDRTTMTLQAFPVDDQLEAEVEQKWLDHYWDKGDIDQELWALLLNARVAGWYIAPMEWNSQDNKPVLWTNVSVREVLIDPSVNFINTIEKANWMFWRRRINWWQGRAMYPHLSRHMAALASEGTERTDPVVQLGKNQQTQTTGEKMVDLHFFWIRNCPVRPMTPEEAVQGGKIEQRAISAQGELPASGAPDPTQLNPTTDSAAVGAQANVSTGGPGGGDESLLAGGEAGAIDLAGGVAGLLPPVSAFFLPNGDQPITPADPEWPWWLATRMISRVDRCIADDRTNPYWDPPFVYMPANPVPMTHLCQGDPETMAKMQDGKNRALTNAVDHSDILAHPVQVFSDAAWANLPPEYQKHGSSIAGIKVHLPNELYQALGGKYSAYSESPPISASVGQILDILSKELEDQSPSPAVTQGRQTGEVTGWQTTQMLQQQASSRLDLPAKFLGKAVERLIKLIRWSILWRAPFDELCSICSDLPPEVVEFIRERGRQSDRNTKAECNISSGGLQAKKIGEAVQKFNTLDPNTGERVIGMDTLRERWGENNKTQQLEQTPKLQALQVMQQMQAQQQDQAGGEPVGAGASSNGDGHAPGANGNGRMNGGM